MNTKNKQHTVYLDFALCSELKRLGFQQDSASAYWSITDKQLYPSDRLSKFRGWEKHFIAAVTEGELGIFIPVFTLIEKMTETNYRITNPRHKVTAYAATEGEAKVKFIQQLVKNKTLKLSCKNSGHS